jgi:hypothetical protein
LFYICLEGTRNRKTTAGPGEPAPRHRSLMLLMNSVPGARGLGVRLVRVVPGLEGSSAWRVREVEGGDDPGPGPTSRVSSHLGEALGTRAMSATIRKWRAGDRGGSCGPKERSIRCGHRERPLDRPGRELTRSGESRRGLISPSSSRSSWRLSSWLSSSLSWPW